MGLDIVEMVIEVETSFGITISDQDASQLRTVGDLYQYVAASVVPADESAKSCEGALWERYLDVLEREIRVARSELRPEARFVQDLGMD